MIFWLYPLNIMKNIVGAQNHQARNVWSLQSQIIAY